MMISDIINFILGFIYILNKFILSILFKFFYIYILILILIKSIQFNINGENLDKIYRQGS